jgi:renalase
MGAEVRVVGAGIAGLACARVLTAAGHSVHVLDRGRHVGGRLASRQLAGRVVDLGASYLTCEDDRFGEIVETWSELGLIAPWTNRFDVYSGEGWSRTQVGPTRYRAPGGLRTLTEQLGEGLHVELEHPVTTVGPGPVVDGEKADAVILAMPDPQAALLLGAFDRETDTAPTWVDWSPVLAVALGWPARAWNVEGVFVNDDPLLAFVADDGQRRGDGAPVIVAHTTSEFAAANLSDPEAGVDSVVDAVRSLLAIPDDPRWTYVHRWTFARPAATHDAAFHLTDSLVGVCGDSWGTPRVETAWLSGHLLGQELVRRLL